MTSALISAMLGNAALQYINGSKDFPTNKTIVTRILPDSKELIEQLIHDISVSVDLDNNTYTTESNELLLQQQRHFLRADALIFA